MALRRTVLAAVLCVPLAGSCAGGGGGTGTLLPLAAARAAAGNGAHCPPAVVGTFAPVPCPDVTLEIVGGRTIAAGAGRSSPPAGGYALLFAADGTFLYDDRHTMPLRRDAAMELDVLTDPAVPNVKRYEWTLWHNAGARSLEPFMVQLRTVGEVSPDGVVPGGPWSFAVSDGTGTVQVAAATTGGLDVPLSQYPWLATAPGPLTLLTFTTQMPQSLCGNCWGALVHDAPHGNQVSGSSP